MTIEQANKLSEQCVMQDIIVTIVEYRGGASVVFCAGNTINHNSLLREYSKTYFEEMEEPECKHIIQDMKQQMALDYTTETLTEILRFLAEVKTIETSVINDKVTIFINNTLTINTNAKYIIHNYKWLKNNLSTVVKSLLPHNKEITIGE